MSRSFLTPINLNKNELQNAAIQNLASAPSNPVTGQVYFDTVIGNLRQYNGTIWLDYITSESGNQFISSVDTTNFTVDSGYLSLNSEIQVQKTSYWRSGTQQGVIAAQSDASLRLTAISGQLQLESNAGDVRINPASTLTWFNNNLFINADSGIIGTDVNSLHLNADNGTITTDTNEFHTPKVEFWNGGDTSGSRLGIIVAHPYDGSLSVAASNQLVLESHSGDINLVPDGQVVVNGNLVASNGHNITASNNVYAAQGLYVGGSDYEQNGFVRVQDGSGNNLFTIDTSAGEAEVDVHGFQKFYTSGGTQYGVIGYDGGANLVINGYNNDIILESDSGYAYIGSNSSPATRIATQSYVDSVAQGLSVLGSVRTATGTNIDITANASDPISGVTLVNGDRVLVKAQDTATENGIYIYNSGSQTLVASTVPTDTDIKEGSYVLVEEGTYAAQGWIVTAFTAGASTWTQFSAAGEYTAGNGIDISSGVISVALDSDSLSVSGSGLKVNYHTDGGLDNDSGLYVKTGTGLTIDNSGNVALNVSSGYGVRKYAVNNSALTNTGGQITWVVNHNLGTQDVTVQLRELDGNSLVEVDVALTDSNNVTLSWVSGDVSADSYRVVVVG
jgi:hypothetical protein